MNRKHAIVVVIFVSVLLHTALLLVVARDDAGIILNISIYLSLLIVNVIALWFAFSSESQKQILILESRETLMRKDLSQSEQLETYSREMNEQQALNDQIVILGSFSSKVSGPILLVENNKNNTEVVLNIFEDLALPIVAVENGFWALVKLLQSLASGKDRFAMILMGCQMPVMDGFETTKRIRAGLGGAANKEIPIVALTANAIHGDRERCLNAGMNDYVAKPLEEAELFRALNQWMPNASVEIEPAQSGVISVQSRQQLQSKEVVWDAEPFAKLLKNRSDRVLKLIQMFQDDLGPRVNAIVTAIEAGESSDLRKTAHALKGSSANLMANQMASICAALELAASDEPTSDLSPLVSGIHLAHATLEQALNNYQPSC